MKRRLLSCLSALVFLASLIPSGDVLADVAPPQTPQGANLNPGAESTNVRMMAETVILTVRQDPQDDRGAIANTVATFTMRNLGTTVEKMQARFPLSFYTGDSDGFGNFPEITEISVKVDGKTVTTQREMQPALSTLGGIYQERTDVPWAVFDVSFPPGKDVTIEVAYPVEGFGYYPYEDFRYILETGAGWNDTIGSADIIVRLPYEASPHNVWLPDETTGYSQTSPGATVAGNEVRWHFENFEPTADNNIEITVVAPSLWQRTLDETKNVTSNPNDGESWGRLAKAYKEIAIMAKHGDPRPDTAGRELFALSQQAYEKCLVLLPNDSLWHFGYADLLWSHYYFDLYTRGEMDKEGLFPRILNELKTSLELDPNNQRAKDLLSWISASIPNSVTISNTGYNFLGLTSTPEPLKPFLFVTETPIPSPTVEIIASATSIPNSPTALPTKQPAPSGSPICSGAGFLLAMLLGFVWWSTRRAV